MDFKQRLIGIYSEMRWKPNRTLQESRVCSDFRIFITTKFQGNDTRMVLNAIDRGDYDPEKKTLNQALLSSNAPNGQQLPQQSHTNNSNISGQSGNAAEVDMSADELQGLLNGASEDAPDIEIKKRGRKPKSV